MAIPLKILSGRVRQFQAADALQVDAIDRRAASGNITIGSNLGATEELVLGSATSDVRVLGDLLINGSSTISVNETVTGNFTVEGNTSLGNNTGDIVNLGGGAADTVNLKADLTVGTGLVGIGSSATDYLTGLWLDAVNANGPNLAAYDLRASGTNAGAYAIGINPALLTNTTATDLMTALDDLDAAITGASGSTGTTNVSFGINTDAIAGTEEDPCIALSGGDGGTSLVVTNFCQDSTAQVAYVKITDTGTQTNPVFAIGDVTAPAVASLTPTLRLVATNTTPTNIIADINFAVTGGNAFGNLIFGGAGLAAGSLVGPATDNIVDLGGAAANRFADAFFGGVTTTGTSFVVGNTTLSTSTLTNSAGALIIDLVSAADGVLTLTNSNGGATGADIDFAVSGSAIRRTGDGLPEILVANLISKGSAETITGPWTFSTNDPIFNQTAARFNERAGDPTNVADAGFVYTKDVSTITELFYEDSSGNVIQLTSNGLINAATTLQSAYATGNTIAVTAANGALQFSNNVSADVTNVLELSKAPAASAAGRVLSVSTGANATGDAVFISNSGSGNALLVQDSGTTNILVSGAGAISLTPTTGQALTLTTVGAGAVTIGSATGAISLTSVGAAVSISGAAASSMTTSSGNLSFDAISGELVFDDIGNSGLTLSQAGDRALDRTGASQILNGATSLIGAINRLARAIDVSGQIAMELPIESGIVVAAGDCLAASTVSGRITLANANADTNIAFIGIAITGGTGDAGGTVIAKIAMSGLVSDTGATFTTQDALYLPDGTGRPTATPPSDIGDYNLRVGYAVSGTQYVLHPSEGIQL